MDDTSRVQEADELSYCEKLALWYSCGVSPLYIIFKVNSQPLFYYKM